MKNEFDEQASVYLLGLTADDMSHRNNGNPIHIFIKVYHSI